ncbi:MAG: bifunctional homocysteine S-methyltransferase/methylenetetrahydrofolate reductase, partial [Myxococcota bacterium]
ITAAKRTGLPVVAHIVFDANRRADGCLSPVDVARRMVDVGADVVGANCGAGPAELYDVGVQMLEIGVPVSIQPNAGFPSVVDGRSIYVANPEHFGVFARRMLKAGIRLIGGCCGTTPDHIRSMLGALRMMSCDSTLPGSSPATADITAGADAVPARPEPIVPLAERSRLGQRIATGAFAVSVELTSPPGTDPSAMLQRIDKLVAAGVDVVNVADGPRATARMGNLSTCSVAAATTGVEPILHVCCRDRNYLGLISHLLGAHALGLRNLVIITGDPPKMGDYPFATPVYDVDSIGLLKMAATLNSGRDPAGKELRGHTSFVLATGAEPAARDYEREMRRLEDKIAAGAELVMTQPVYDPATLDRFLNDVQPMNIPIMVGLLPLASHRNAEFLHNEVPGMQIPQEYRDRMAAVGSGPAARAEGVRIAQEALIAVKHRVAGAYIMPPFNRVESAISILEVVKDRWTPAQKPEPSPLVADRAPAPAKAAAS